MAACLGASSSARLLLLSLLGLCVALSHQQSSSDSCSKDKLAVASLVPFDSTAFRCTTAWKKEDFILRVCVYYSHFSNSFLFKKSVCVFVAAGSSRVRSRSQDPTAVEPRFSSLLWSSE